MSDTSNILELQSNTNVHSPPSQNIFDSFAILSRRNDQSSVSRLDVSFWRIDLETLLEDVSKHDSISIIARKDHSKTFTHLQYKKITRTRTPEHNEHLNTTNTWTQQTLEHRYCKAFERERRSTRGHIKALPRNDSCNFWRRKKFSTTSRRRSMRRTSRRI